MSVKYDVGKRNGAGGHCATSHFRRVSFVAEWVLDALPHMHWRSPRWGCLVSSSEATISVYGYIPIAFLQRSSKSAYALRPVHVGICSRAPPCDRIATSFAGFLSFPGVVLVYDSSAQREVRAAVPGEPDIAATSENDSERNKIANESYAGTARILLDLVRTRPRPAMIEGVEQPDIPQHR